MTDLTLKRLLGTAALALALGACNDSPASTVNPPGELAFDYTGAQTGQFRASGAYNSRANTLLDYSAAFFAGGELIVLASDELGTGRSNLFVISLPPSVGTSSCTAATPLSSCLIRAQFLTGASSDPNQGNEGLYAGNVGSVQVTEIANNRVRGTFSITLEGADETEGSIEVRSGSFDAPLVSPLQLDPNRGRFPVAAAPVFSRTR
jgi:hypothetical protein